MKTKSRPSLINIQRRNWLKSAGFAAASGSLLGTLGGLQRAQAAASGDDYKALVCIYLDGGADCFNLLIPTDAGNDPVSGHANYAEQRGGVYSMDTNPGGMAIARSEVLSLNGQSFGLHPGMEQMQSLFNGNRLAAVANVGSLLEPVAKPAIEAGTARLPDQLFSHSDQNLQWHKAWADAQEPKGWFGRAADLLESMNSNTSPSMNISIHGNNVLQVGDSVVPYSMSPNGPEGLDVGYDEVGSPRIQNTVEAIMAESAHLFGVEYSTIKARAIENFELLSAALRAQIISDNETQFTPIFNPPGADDNYLSSQLEMVARMIDLRDTVGACRQTFFVNLGGWDTHDGQLRDLPNLTRMLSDAMGRFDQALGLLGLRNDVTTFTMSEFSRTLNSNGNGTDHGWGGHQFVMGGAVNGGQIYGQMPQLILEGPEDIDRGRLIPTLAVEQFAATLASWFGVGAGDLNTVFPNLNRFASSDLGFMG